MIFVYSCQHKYQVAVKRTHTEMKRKHRKQRPQSDDCDFFDSSLLVVAFVFFLADSRDDIESDAGWVSAVTQAFDDDSSAQLNATLAYELFLNCIYYVNITPIGSCGRLWLAISRLTYFPAPMMRSMIAMLLIDIPVLHFALSDMCDSNGFWHLRANRLHCFSVAEMHSL